LLLPILDLRFMELVTMKVKFVSIFAILTQKRRPIEEINIRKNELNSWKAAVSNEVRIYQQFCDKDFEMNKKINELQVTINESETKKVELQNTVTGFKQQLSVLQDGNTDKTISAMKMESLIVHPFHLYLMIRPCGPSISSFSM